MDRAELRDRDLEVGQHLQQERLELVVGTVDLVDQQHHGVVGVDRLQQRASDQELRPEQLVLGDGSFLRSSDVEELARVVPLVDGMGDVQALVALQPDQARTECDCERLRRLRLADAGLAFQQQGLLQREREEERRRQAPIGQVVGSAERRLEIVDGAEGHHRSVPGRLL
mgnify:CR=1 FL=1